jgi:hypothetical protein
LIYQFCIVTIMLVRATHTFLRSKSPLFLCCVFQALYHEFQTVPIFQWPKYPTGCILPEINKSGNEQKEDGVGLQRATALCSGEGVPIFLLYGLFRPGNSRTQEQP